MSGTDLAYGFTRARLEEAASNSICYAYHDYLLRVLRVSATRRSLSVPVLNLKNNGGTVGGARDGDRDDDYCPKVAAPPYCPTHGMPLCPYACPMRFPVLIYGYVSMPLRARCAMSSTEIGYAPIVLRVCFQMSSTEIGHAAMLLGIGCAVSGTRIGYAATHLI
eukprot:3319277-Rhodomonas_salina.1